MEAPLYSCTAISNKMIRIAKCCLFNTLPHLKTPFRAAVSTLSQAVNYERFGASQRDEGVKLINRLSIKPGSTVLDLGCGTGYLAKVLSKKVGNRGRVVAVDPDEERLEVARQLYSADNIHYNQADDKSFPLVPYDLVFCNATIHWIRDKERLFQRVHRTLQPGGCFAFTTPDSYLPIPSIGKKLFDSLLGPEFLHRMQTEVKVYLSTKEYLTLALDTGFEVTSIRTENIEVYWADLDQYVEAMFGWFGGEFDPSQFDENVLQRLREENQYGPVVLPEPIRKLEFILTKTL